MAQGHHPVASGLTILGAEGPNIASPSRDWYDAIWPIVTGCTRVSEGCRHCTAESMASFSGDAIHTQDGRWSGVVTTHSERLRHLERSEPCRVFICPTADLFHDAVPDSFIEQVLEWITERYAAWRFGVSTKRPERMVAFFSQHTVPVNLWPGVSVESPDVISRVDTIAALRSTSRLWVSVEPMLAPIAADLTPFFTSGVLRWVAAGPEVGPGRRPCEAQWMRDLHDACKSTGVPFFTKHLIDGQAVREVPL